jgi:hypothetical protein
MNVYPSTRTRVHTYQIPSDNLLCVKDGTPVRRQNRDVRFPTVWEVKTHPKTHGRFVTKIWVILIDTSQEARLAASTFEGSLGTPLGPDYRMKEYGMHPIGVRQTYANITVRFDTS